MASFKGRFKKELQIHAFLNPVTFSFTSVRKHLTAPISHYSSVCQRESHLYSSLRGAVSLESTLDMQENCFLLSDEQPLLEEHCSDCFFHSSGDLTEFSVVFYLSINLVSDVSQNKRD